MEPEVGDPVEGVLGGVHGDVALGRVQDVGDPDLFQVLDVLDGFSVAEDDAGVDLKSRFLIMSNE